MTKTIRAGVTQDILGKAERFFNGSDSQRCIELLQNARRAGATHVTITCDQVDSPAPFRITVSDNGRGIEDFRNLINMGGSGWRGELAESEDPAGVGFFCLKPMPVTVTSKGQRIQLYGSRWTGEPIPIEEAPSRAGTQVEFTSPTGWKAEMVEALSIFSGIEVQFNGQVIPPIPFNGALVKHLPELGVRLSIAIKPGSEHFARARHWTYGEDYRDYRTHDVYLNFHGQVLSLSHSVCTGQPTVCVNLTGEPTALRMVLPGRTALHKNLALTDLLQQITRYVFEYFKAQSNHNLPYSDWQKAKALGVELPETRPCFSTGLQVGENGLEELDVPESSSLALSPRLYRVDDDEQHVNAYLAARMMLHKAGDTRFVPIDVAHGYMGYSWAKNLPQVTEVKLQVEKFGGKDGEPANSFNSGSDFVIVKSIQAEIQTSDGQVFRQALSCAKQGYTILICTDVFEHLTSDDLFELSESYSEDAGKDYQDQVDEFATVLGELIDDATDYPDALRRRLAAAMHSALYRNKLAPEWASVTVDCRYDSVTIQAVDGTQHKLVGSEVTTR